MGKKLCIACCLTDIDPMVYSSHLSMFYRAGKNLPDLDIIFSGPVRMPIDKARNYSVSAALASKCDKLLFYDDDMLMDADIIQKLLERDKPIVSALCYIRGYPFNPMMFRYNDAGHLDIYNHTEDDVKDGLVKVDAVGCACVMIDTSLFKAIPEPWFCTGDRHTEDIYFCAKAKSYISDVEIFIDTQVECGHLLNKPILTTGNRELLKKLYENDSEIRPIKPNPFIEVAKNDDDN